MKHDSTYRTFMSIVVLKQFLRTCVPYFDTTIYTARCDGCTVRMKSRCRHGVVVIVQSIRTNLSGNVPEFHEFVISTRDYTNCRWIERSCAYPIRMSEQRATETSFRYAPNFHRFIVGTGEQELRIGRDLDASHARRMCLDHVTLAVHFGFPQSYGLILRS